MQKYRDRWEQSERENLKADIANKVAGLEADRQYKESYDAIDQQELEKCAEESVAPKEGVDPPTEEVKQSTMKKCRFTS